MITLKDHQKECVTALIESKAQSKMVVLPTGSGKTIVFISYIQSIRKKALVLVHTKELQQQIKNTIEKFFPEISCSFLSAKTANTDCDVYISTIQSMGYGCSLEKAISKNIELIVIDECHHALCNTYSKVISEFISKNRKTEIIGVTATPIRSDNRMLSKVFRKTIYSKSIFDMIKCGILTDIEAYCIKTGVNLEGIRTQNGDFSSKELASVLDTQERNYLILTTYQKICLRKKTIIFCSSILHAKHLEALFLNEGIATKCIYGEMNLEERSKIIKDYKNGTIQVLMNCMLLTEGFDEPSIECVMLARPTKSKTLYIQMIGRGLRTFAEKEKCLLIDFSDQHHDICDIYTALEFKKPDESRPHLKSIMKEFETIQKQKKSSDGSIHINRKILFKPEYLFELATETQKRFLADCCIEYSEPLSYETASLMISNFKKRKILCAQ